MGITASAIRAGRAFVELSLEKTKFVRDLRKLQNSLRSTGNYLKGLGNDMMLLGGTGTLPFAGALKMFADFDDKMRTLKAVTGATDAQMAYLRAQTKELGATTAFTASQVGDASVTLARMGLGVNGVKNGLKPMLNLTRATGTETHRVGEAAQFAASTLGQYDLEASKFADICDVMAYAANHSAMDIFDMGEAMKIAGPSAKTVNEDIRDTAASLMLLANAGVRGSLAGTSLRKIYQSLAAQSGNVEGLTKEQIAEGVAGQEQLRQMGISIVDPKTGNLRKAADIMAEMAEKVKDMANGEKINFATDIFDLRGSLGALTMLQNPWDLKKFRQELNSVAGYAQKAADEIESGPGGMLRLLRSQFEDIAISIGEAVYSVIEPFKDNLKIIAMVIKKIITSNQALIGNIALVLSGTFALGVALVAIGVYFKILAAGIGLVIGAMKTLHFVLALPVRTILKIVDTIKKLKKAIHDIGNAISSFLQIAQDMYSSLRSVGETAVNVFKKIPSPLFLGKAAVSALRGAVLGFGVTLVALERALQVLQLGMFQMYTALGMLRGAGTACASSFAAFRAALMSNIIVIKATALATSLYSSATAFCAGIVTAATTAFATSSSVIASIKASMLAAYASVKSFSIATYASSVATKVLTAAITAARAVWTGIAAAVASVTAAIKGFSITSFAAATAQKILYGAMVVNKTVISGIRSAIIMLKGAYTSLSTATTAAALAVKLAFGAKILLGVAVVAAAIAVVAANFETVKKVAGSFGEWIGGVFKKMWSAVSTWASKIFAIVKDSFGWIKDAVMSGDLEGAWKMTLATLVAVFYEAVAPIRQLWGSFCSFFMSAWSVTKAAVLQGINYLAYGALESFYAMSDGIMNTWDSLWNGVLKKFDDVLYNAQIAWVKFKGMFDKNINVGFEVSKIENERNKQRAKRDQQLSNAVSARQERQKQLADMKAQDQKIIDENKQKDLENAQKIKTDTAVAIERDRQSSEDSIADAKKFINLGKVANDAEKKLKDFFDNSQERYRLHEMSGDQRTLSHLATLEKMKNENPKQAESFLRVYADRIAKQKEVIQEEFDKALEEAKSDRNITAEETKKLQGIAMRFGKASELESRYKQMLENSASTVKSQVGMATGDTKTLGAWSASALGRMWGGAGSPAERTARATERQNKLMEKNNSYLAEMKDGITYA